MEVKKQGTILAANVSCADGFFLRLRGLMFRKTLGEQEGLFLRNCSAIHCCFMHFPIDVVYLDTNLMVVGVETVYPWHIGHRFPNAKHTLELGNGKAVDVAVGDRLELH